MLGSAEAVYEDPWKQVSMIFMASGREFYEAGNASHWLDQRKTSFPRPT